MPQVHGVHYKSLWCTFMAWIDEPHSPHVYRMLMSWLVEEKKNQGVQGRVPAGP
jgi:hypothetical protein